jgi:hypothetical protein
MDRLAENQWVAPSDYCFQRLAVGDEASRFRLWQILRRRSRTTGRQHHHRPK